MKYLIILLVPWASSFASDYEALLSSGDAEVLFQLGDAQTESENYGDAIFAYLEAIKLDPRNEELRRKLRYARGEAGYANNPLEPTLLSRTTQLERQVIGLSLMLLSCALWLINQRIAFLISVCLTSIWLYLSLNTVLDTGAGVIGKSSSTRAVVRVDEALVLSAPREGEQSIALLSDGAELGIGSIQDGWVKVFLPKGRVGWLPKGEIHIWED